MKVTIEQVKAFTLAYDNAPGVASWSKEARTMHALQAVFDFHIPLNGIQWEPTEKQVERAYSVWMNFRGDGREATVEALKAAMNEPPKKYPWAEQIREGHYRIHTSPDYSEDLRIGGNLTFDCENMTLNAKWDKTK